MPETEKNNKMVFVHYAVILFFCFLFRYVPPIGQLTPTGMGIVGTFIGAVYGWTALNMLWPSFAALLGLGIIVGMPNLITGAFGNNTFIGVVFIFMFMGVCNELGALNWMVEWLLRRKLFMGKPYVTIWFFLFIAMCLGFFGGIYMLLFYLEILIAIFKKLEIKPFTKLPTLIFLGVVYAVSMGQVVIPFMGQSLILVQIYQAMSQTMLNLGQYLLFTLPLSLVMITVFVLIMKLIFRVDVSPLKNINLDFLGELSPATREQKISLIILVLMLSYLCAGSIPFLGILYETSAMLGIFGVAAVVMLVLLVIKRDDGTPMINIYKASGTISWDILLMLAYIMVLANYMQDPSTGISPTLASILAPLTQYPPLVFVVGVLVLTTIITNFANNLVVTICALPILISYYAQIGTSPDGITYLLFFSCALALATPGASVLAAAAFSRTDYVNTGMMVKYAVILLPILLIFIIGLGVPYSAILF